MSERAAAERRSARVNDLPLDDLLAETLDRVKGLSDERRQLQLLLDTVITLAADLSLDGVLQQIVRAASTLLDARYAALGVLNPPGHERRLRMLVQHGLSEEQLAVLSDGPRGLGVLGALIRDPAPLRLRDLSQHPAHQGFPTGMPPMHSFLGVPILIHGEVYGNLYVTEKTTTEEFSDADEKTAVALAAAAGVVIENARMYSQAAQRERWLEATAEVTSALSDAVSVEDAAPALVDQARRSANADAVWLVAVDDEENNETVPGHRLRSIASADPSGSFAFQRHDEFASVAASKASRVLDGLVVQKGDEGAGPGILVPITVVGRSPGVLALGWSADHRENPANVDSGALAHFADRVSLALQALQSRQDRQRIALLEDRDRIAEDLHDVVIQRLFAIGLSLQSIARHDEGSDGQRLGQAADDLDTTIRDIRRTIFSLQVPATAADVQSRALQLATQARRILKFQPTITFAGPVRSMLTGPLADDVLAVLAEALSNAARHARPDSVDVSLSVDGGRVRLSVSDDGIGIPTQVVESGLANLRARAERHGGTCIIDSADGAGTTIDWSVPLTQP
ncbi:GAF domain-containing sensor histidine kinase [Paramicrobacterium chengjingii]|uniref:GAF domain-containing protein n=1 Tax=Paramicrobacterium chengjingii TaxID=2769067 RepID=A0ABX6YFZ5_9MICO|nr:GAF domain-containing sensor histidine kinase [Microbacterium chengjingii]QPZ37668.1 GAF domain-containing protein [Microbacterium chengjingii]